MRKKTLQAIRDHGVAAYPLECCGLVLKSGRREWYQPCRNTAASAEHFVMSAEDYAAAEESGDIVAVVHSHPDAPAAPSEADRVACEASGLPWYIVAVEKSENGDVVAGEIRGFAPEGYRAPLLGRQFAHGVLDCYTLVRDWYARERDIVLPDFSRDDGWWEPGKPGDLYMDHYAEAGFRPLRADETLGPGDVVLMQVRSDRANHAGVFLGDEPLAEAPACTRCRTPCCITCTDAIPNAWCTAASGANRPAQCCATKDKHDRKNTYRAAVRLAGPRLRPRAPAGRGQSGRGGQGAVRAAARF